MKIINFIKEHFQLSTENWNGGVAFKEFFIWITSKPMYNYPEKKIVGYYKKGPYIRWGRLGYDYVGLDGKKIPNKVGDKEYDILEDQKKLAVNIVIQIFNLK
jgi:hypothetical protein